MQFTIEELIAGDPARVEGAARLLNTAFAPLGVWTTISEARQEVLDSIAPDRISRVAVSGDGGIFYVEFDGVDTLFMTRLIGIEKPQIGMPVRARFRRKKTWSVNDVYFVAADVM